MNFKIATWNVLHIVHEINHNLANSIVIKDGHTFDESKRTNVIYKIISDLVNDNVIVCLQEVYGDLRDKIREDSDKFKSFEYKLQRTPKITNKSLINTQTAQTIYKNINEYLMIIVPKSINYVSQTNIQYDVDDGKSAIILVCSQLTIINTHLPFVKDKRMKSLIQLHKKLNELNILDNFVMLGDTNAIYPVLNEELLSLNIDVNFADIMDNTYFTINKDGSRKGKKIDHIIHTKNIISSAKVFNTYDLSDHKLVQCTLEIK